MDKPDKNQRGRPTIYNEDLAAKILELLASGETILTIEAMDGMPSRTTIWRWQQNNSTFMEQYARAQRARCDVIVAELLTIADNPLMSDSETLELLGVKKRPGDDGIAEGEPAEAKLVVTEVKRADNVARSKLMTDVRLRILRAWDPATWGDKVAVDNKHSGNVGFALTIMDTPEGDR